MHPTSARRSLSARLILAAVVAACSSGPTASPPNAPSGNSLYVANSSCPSCGAPASVTIYPAGATGNATPTATIAGSSTGLSVPTGIAVDPAGRLYVTNIMGNNNSITVYAVGATGNAAPSAAITGSNTSLRNPDGIAVDAAGQLYVTNANGPSITVYSAGATGNATPTATIAGGNTGLNSPRGIALDAAGSVYVANAGGNSITVYAASATGNAMPMATIAGSNTGLSNPFGIAFDAAGQLYIANCGCLGGGVASITIYAAGATGNATPMATIAGSNTGLTSPAGIAVDAAGRLYVTNLAGNGISVNSITVYAASATGNATPTATIAGSNTELSAPAFMVAH